MYQLIYISTATDQADQSAVDAIVRHAARANAARGVTGLLIHDGVRFVQYLEGEKQAVRTLFDHIAGDPRHRACRVIREGEAAGRQFPNWSMAGQFAVSGKLDMLIAEVSGATAACDAVTAAHLVGFARVRGG